MEGNSRVIQMASNGIIVEPKMEVAPSSLQISFYTSLYPELAETLHPIRVNNLIERIHMAAECAADLIGIAVSDDVKHKMMINWFWYQGIREDTLELCYKDVIQSHPGDPNPIRRQVYEAEEPEMYFVDIAESDSLREYFDTFRRLTPTGTVETKTGEYRLLRGAIIAARQEGLREEDVADDLGVSVREARTIVTRHVISSIDFHDKEKRKTLYEELNLSADECQYFERHVKSTTKAIQPKGYTAISNHIYFTFLNDGIRAISERGYPSRTIDLIRQLGHSQRYTEELLRRYDLFQWRKKIERDSDDARMSPSHDLAYLLGILSLGGKESDSTIGMSQHEDDAVRKKFAELAMKLFDREIFQTSDGYDCFTHARLVRRMGSIKLDQWPNTIQKIHPWILENDAYLKTFLSGLIDVGFTVGESQVKFTSVHERSVLFVVDLLDRLEIPYTRYKSQSKGAMQYSLVVSDSLDRKRLAQYLHLNNPEKEAMLQRYRDINPTDIGKRHSDADLIEAWRKIRSLNPDKLSMSQLDLLAQSGDSPAWANTFMDRFGSIGIGPYGKPRYSFNKAKEVLDAHIQRIEENAIEDEASP